MHPFLDVSKLTDEEILERLNRAHQFLAYQKALGHMPTVQSIEEVIESLDYERERRLARNIDEEFKKKYPKDLDPIDVGKIEE